jgi:hypothetical protein
MKANAWAVESFTLWTEGLNFPKFAFGLLIMLCCGPLFSDDEAIEKNPTSTPEEAPSGPYKSDSFRLKYWVPLTQLASSPMNFSRKMNGDVNELIDFTHDRIGRVFVNASTRFDNLFNNSEDFSTQNFSYLKLRTGIVWAQSENIDPILRIRARVDLPYFKRRFKLVITSATEQFFNEELHGTEDNFRVNESVRGNDYSLSTALRWTMLQAKRYQLNFDSGVKVSFNPKVFIKARYDYLYPINSVWDFQFREQLFGVINDESGSTTSFDFNRKISERRLFNISQRLHYTDRSQGVEFSHGYSLYQILENNRAISYSCSVSGHSDPVVEHTDFGLGIQYRQPIFRSWMQLFIEPEMHYPRAYHWEPQHQITIGLESIFGNPKS